MTRLLDVSFSDTTYPTYGRAWHLFYTFHNLLHNAAPTLPLTQDSISLFISYLSYINLAPNTIHTYVSAINHINQLNGGEHLSSSFMSKKLLVGVDKSTPAKPKRLPITIDILHSIIHQLGKLAQGRYTISLFQALFSSMFYLGARVGEVSTSQGRSKNTLLLSHFSIPPVPAAQSPIQVSFHHFKHNKSASVHVINIHPDQSIFCPVSLVRAFAAHRGPSPGPFFMHKNSKPVTASEVAKMLAWALRTAGWDPSLYGTHSFRIGWITHLAGLGASDAKMRSLGRFHSNAFKKYIRHQAFTDA